MVQELDNLRNDLREVVLPSGRRLVEASPAEREEAIRIYKALVHDLDRMELTLSKNSLLRA